MNVCAKPRSFYLRFILVCVTSTAGFSGLAQDATRTPFYRWTTLAGHPTTGYADGPAADALFNNPHGIAVDTNNNVYVADSANHVVRKISPQGVVSTLAGSPGNPGSADGTGSAARFAFPNGLAVDAAGNVYVADTENHTLRKITPAGVVTTLAGKAGETGDGTGSLESVRFSRPSRIFADKDGNVYFGTTSGFRRITSSEIEDITVNLNDPAFYENNAPTTALTARIAAADWNGNFYIVAGVGAHSNGTNVGSYKIRRIVRIGTDGAYSILASSDYGSGKPYISDSVSITLWANDAFGNMYYVTQLLSSIIEHRVYQINPDGTVDGAPWRPADRGGYEDTPIGLSADSHGTILHTAETDDAIFRSADGSSQVLAGTAWSSNGQDGTGSNARFANITSLAVNADAEVIAGDSFVTYNTHHYYSGAARKVTASGLTTTIYTGRPSERQWTSAELTVGPDNTIYLSTRSGGILSLFAITLGGSVSTLAPDDSHSRLEGPVAVADDSILVAEATRINRRSSTGEWSVLAGGNVYAIKDGVGTEAHFFNIGDLAPASNGDLYAMDDASLTGAPKVLIRKITPNREVSTVGENLIQDENIIPRGMTYDAKGDFVLSYNDDTIRLITSDGTMHVIGGQSGASGTRDGSGSDARFFMPGAITTDANNNIYVADNAGVTIRQGEFLGFNATITGQPQSLTVEAGTTAEFSVTAQGTPEPSYQWYFNGVAITGATTSTLTISNSQTANAGSYTVTVNNSLSTVTSAAATLTVTTPSTPPPTNGGGNNNGGDSTPPPPTSGGSSGGGAPSTWLIGALTVLILVRYWPHLTASRA